jgi:glycosyltransferase involved in cell wall biosynthesis
LIKHGETGYLVQSEDDMIAAMQRLDTLDRGRCRAWVRQHFSVEKMIEGYETLYKNVARCRRGRESDSQPNRVL